MILYLEVIEIIHGRKQQAVLIFGIRKGKCMVFYTQQGKYGAPPLWLSYSKNILQHLNTNYKKTRGYLFLPMFNAGF